jgi:hypothetical protein
MRNNIAKVEKVSIHRLIEIVKETKNILTSTICGVVWTININLHSQNTTIKM